MRIWPCPTVDEDLGIGTYNEALDVSQIDGDEYDWEVFLTESGMAYRAGQREDDGRIS